MVRRCCVAACLQPLLRCSDRALHGRHGPSPLTANGYTCPAVLLPAARRSCPPLPPSCRLHTAGTGGRPATDPCHSTPRPPLFPPLAPLLPPSYCRHRGPACQGPLPFNAEPAAARPLAGRSSPPVPPSFTPLLPVAPLLPPRR